MNKNVLYLVDDYLLLYSKNNQQILKYKVGNKALKNGKIANVKNFLTSYKKFIKENNLNNNIFGDTLYIIVNPSYTKVDIDVLTNVFKSLNYRKVFIINEMKLYNLNVNNAYINYNNSYTIISYMDIYKVKHSFILENEFFNQENIISILKNNFKKRSVYFFGLNKNIESVIERLELSSHNIGYHFANDENYLINEFLK